MSFGVKKRFWTDVGVEQTEAGFVVQLDGRSVKTPDRADLALPTRAAADLVAAEWDAQDGELDPAGMPATRWANVAIDRVGEQHDAVVDMLAEYGASDLLCYRATHPDALIARQAAVWDAPLAWAAKRFDAPLVVTQGVIPVDQPNQSVANLRKGFADFDPFSLSAFHELVQITGSLVLSLGIAEGEMDGASVWDAVRVDEIWQNEQWGEDDEAAQAAAAKRDSLLLAEKLLKSVRGG